MAFENADAPGRSQEFCAKKAWIAPLLRRLLHHWRQRKHPKVPTMNAHIARDIGLSEHEQARLNHQWPSQTMHHPRG